jgi:hypothetical protein
LTLNGGSEADRWPGPAGGTACDGICARAADAQRVSAASQNNVFDVFQE